MSRRTTRRWILTFAALWAAGTCASPAALAWQDGSPASDSGAGVRGADPGDDPAAQAAPSDGAQLVGQDPLSAEPQDIQTASFQGVVPGQSTIKEVQQALGQPRASKNDGDNVQLEYRVGPFPKVEITASGGVTTSIVIHLSRTVPPVQVAGELGLNDFRPATIEDEVGRALGQAYPERGVLFVFAADQQQPAVSHILLEPISAEPFILRAQSDRARRYAADLADLNYAQRLDPSDARTYAGRAELLGRLGHVQAGLESIAKAVELEPDNLAHRVAAAELYIAGGDHEHSLQLVEAVAARETAPLAIRAKAERLWGDILASGAGGDFQAAVKHQTRCIELAMKLAAEKDDQGRREARQLVLDAHLSIARSIACGNWQNKEATVDKWLTQAGRLAEDAIARGEAQPLLRLSVQRGKLAALAGASSGADPAPIAAAAIQTVRDALAANDDTLFQSQVMWELGQTMFYASVAAQLRGRGEEAIKFGNQAFALLDEAADSRDSTPADRYLLGQTCFRLGSYYAVNSQDHARAVEWYQKALLHFADGLPDSAAAEMALHGERYVSMGASYWKAGQQSAALKLTEQGVELIEQAVERGEARPEVLAIPYGNLAAMHRKSGNEKKAEELARLAERLEMNPGEQSNADSDTQRR